MSIPDGPALPDWLTVDATVYVSGRVHVQRVKVKRITATQVVIENSAGQVDRYRRSDLSRIKNGSWDHDRLVPLDDPHVIEVLRNRRIADVAYDAEKACAAIRNADDPVEAARAAVRILQGFIATEQARP